MKKFILALLLVSPMVFAVEFVRPSDGGSEYVESDRFVTTDMKNPLDKIVTDTKTGCQFAIILADSGVSQIMLGCFEEYKRK